MRFDCNLSLQNEDEFASGKLPNYRTETKNINSIRSLGRAIEYEIIRQSALLEKGERPVQETRGWKDDLNKSTSQRSKEEAMDYRYFPEPDLKVLEVTSSDIPDLKDLAELPSTQRKRYLEEGLSMQITNTFVSQENVGKLFDTTSKKSQNTETNQTLANIISGPLISLATKLEKPIEDVLNIDNLNSITILFHSDSINNQGLATALEKLAENPNSTTEEVVKKFNLLQITDEKALQTLVDEVITANSKTVEDYKSGKVQVIGFLVGQCMKESKGTGNPKKFGEILTRTLNS